MFENVNNGVFDFDGATNYISFNSINLGTTYTIQFWVKRGDTGNTGVIIGNSTGTQKKLQRIKRKIWIINNIYI
jgi:hypothetical protein